MAEPIAGAVAFGLTLVAGACFHIAGALRDIAKAIKELAAILKG